MGRQTRIDLALSLDIHRSNAGAYIFKSLFRLKNSENPKQQLAEQRALQRNVSFLSIYRLH